MKKVVYFLVFLLLFIGFFHPVYSITQDLGRHLKTGEIILNNLSVPKTNLFSYTYPNFPFINHHWLSEVVYFTLFQKLGFNGLLILNTMLALLSFGLIFSIANKKNRILSLLFSFLLYAPILFERVDVRPEFFSFLFLSFFIVILYRFRSYYHNDKTYHLIFLLPFIEVLWVNVHIYFPIGIVLIAFFIIDGVLKNKSFNLRYIGILAVVLVGCVLATILNPNGLNGAFYPFRVFQNYGYSIEENQNIFFLWSLYHKQSIFFFFISLPLLFIALILNFKRVLLVDWLISIFFTILAVISVRNFPLFVFATFTPFAKYVSNIKLSLPKYLSLAFFILLLGLAIFEAWAIYGKLGFGFGVEKGAKDAADFFLKNNLKGPIFNNFDIGSYLDYSLYPKEKVFVDGRPEAYPTSFFQTTYIPMQLDTHNFALVDQKYNFNTIFFSHTDQTPWAEKFIKQITQNNKWSMVYLDDWTFILTKDKNAKPSINTDYANLKSLVQLAHFFQNTNFEDQEIRVYQKILSIDPKHCPVLYNLSLKLQRKNDPSFPIFLNRFQQNCKSQ